MSQSERLAIASVSDESFSSQLFSLPSCLIQPKEDNALGLLARKNLAPIPRAISSLCRSVWLVFIMTRLNLVEGTDEYWIVGLAMKVRNQLGFSMLESVYERALMMEFEKAGVPAERQVSIPVFYDGEKLNHGYAADIIVDNRILLELKAVTRLYAIHRRQIQFYLDASKIESGLLINFGKANGLECEWFKVQNSGYNPAFIPPIPDGELVPSEDCLSAKTGSLSERVNHVLGNDTVLGGDA